MAYEKFKEIVSQKYNEKNVEYLSKSLSRILDKLNVYAKKAKEDLTISNENNFMYATYTGANNGVRLKVGDSTIDFSPNEHDAISVGLTAPDRGEHLATLLYDEEKGLVNEKTGKVFDFDLDVLELLNSMEETK